MEDLERVYYSWEEVLAKPTVKNLLVGKDGLYEVRKTNTGVFAVKLTGEEEVKEGFELAVPKIPGVLLQQALYLFRTLTLQEKPVECLVDFYFDGEKYFIHVPRQRVDKVNVQVLDSLEVLTMGFKNTLVCELHSHNTGETLFSEKDNDDEVATGIYGVVGNITETSQKIKCRFSCGGHYRYIDSRHVFDYGQIGTQTEFPEMLKALERIEIGECCDERVDED